MSELDEAIVRLVRVVRDFLQRRATIGELRAAFHAVDHVINKQKSI